MKLHLQKGEKILYKSGPKTAVLFLWIIGLVIFLIFISIPFSMIFSFWILLSSIAKEFSFGTQLISFFVVFIALLIIGLLYLIALRKSYKYYITNERVVFQGGIIVKRIKNVPFHKITDVSISQNIIERALGISKMSIQTAGAGINIPEIKFIGLEDAEKPQNIILKQLKSFKPRRYASTYSE